MTRFQFGRRNKNIDSGLESLRIHLTIRRKITYVAKRKVLFLFPSLKRWPGEKIFRSTMKSSLNQKPILRTPTNLITWKSKKKRNVGRSVWNSKETTIGNLFFNLCFIQTITDLLIQPGIYMKFIQMKKN